MTTLKKSLLSFACLMAATAANAATGHIYAISPWVNGAQVDPDDCPVSSPEHALVGGDTMRFTLRMCPEQNYTGEASSNKWYTSFIGLGSEEMAKINNAFRIGIFVSGELREATLENEYHYGSTDEYSDFIFRYDVKPGDFALPVVLAMKDGTPATGEFQADTAYYINPRCADDWWVRNAKGETANFWFGELGHPSGAGKRVTDYDLRQAGFYVKTIDFDTKWVVEPDTSVIPATEGVWRRVHEGSTETTTVAPSLALVSAPSNSVTLHIWSDNNAAAVVQGDNTYQVVMKLNKDGTLLATNTVLDVKVQAGQTSIPFEIYGVASNETAHIILSANTNYTYNSSGMRYTDYVSVPVECVERLPANVTATAVELETDDELLDPISVNSNYQYAVARVKVTASTGYTNALTVTVTPKLMGDAVNAWSNYIHVANENKTGKWASLEPCTLTFTAEDIANQKPYYVYLFAMGADSKTASPTGGIQFDVAIDTAAQTYYEKVQSDSIVYFQAAAPVIVSPTEGEALTANGNVKREFDIVVSDNYRNMNDRTTGYNVFIKRTNKENVTELDGYAPNEEGILYKLASDGSLTTEKPAITYYTAGEYDTQIYIVSPGSKKSEVRKITVSVSEPASVSAVTDLNAANSTNEGEMATFYLKLSEKNATGQAIYGFLVPEDVESSNRVQATCISSQLTGQKGLKIGAGKDQSEKGSLLFLDGRSRKKGGTALDYKLVLCYTAKYDETRLVEGFDSDNLTLTIFNVEPKVNEVKMDNIDSVSEDGGTMPDLVSKGVEKTFSFDIEEPGSLDLEAEGSEMFQLRYTIKEAGGASTNAILYGNANTNSFKYAFRSTGTATVTVELMDKDMKEYPGKFGGKFVFYVGVTDQPRVSITSESGVFDFYEDRLGARNTKMKICLTRNPSTENLDFAVVVTPKATDAENPGSLTLDCGTQQSTNRNVYIVTFSPGQTEAEFSILDADGTGQTASRGYALQASCVATSLTPEGQHWSSFFAPETPVILTLQNANPTIESNALGEENTASNAIPAAVGNYDPIDWRVSDVDLDLGQEGSTTNLTVVWRSDGATLTTNVCSATNTYYFTPKFTTSGSRTVYVTVTDKDGGKTTKKWYFDVQTSKTLVAYPVGPSGSASTLSGNYRALAGCGEGHVWFDGATFTGMSRFKQEWNCGLSGNVYGYAWGYKTGSVDDGRLDCEKRFAMDVPASPLGNNDTDGSKAFSPDDKTSYYNYAGAKDSFLYLWVKTTIENGAGTATVDKFAPERWNGTVSVTPDIYQPTLPVELDQSGIYPNTLVEAVFSKEYLTSDNMGDINQDGIPDLYLQVKGFGVYDATTGTLTGDTKDLSTYNADLDESGSARADYIPGKANKTYAYFIPECSNATYGVAFTAVQELRGAYQMLDGSWSGLNDALASAYVQIAGVKTDVVYDNPETNALSTLTKLEWDAFQHWCALQTPALKPADSNNWSRWSPECPSDPTKYDSDTDGLSDGYEYYYWYKAHVGYYDAAGDHQFLTGRRYVPAAPLEPTEISSDEIEQAMNPSINVDHDVDTDNDGLTDFEEAALGTNPFDFDTDSDGLPDGYEVVCSLTDPCSALDGDNGSANFDGDAMASYTYKKGTPDFSWYVAELTNGVTVCSQEKFQLGETAPGVSNIVYDADAKIYSTWLYDGEKGKSTAVYCRGRQLYVGKSYTNAPIVAVTRETMKLIHFHVYQTFGFDPRTGWKYTTLPANHSVNTVEFTARDEFLTMAFFLHAGGLTEADVTPSIGKPLTTIWLNYTTCPVLKRTLTSGEGEGVRYGADTDRDGMPDGWELYLMAGPAPEAPGEPIPDGWDQTLIAHAAPDSDFSPLYDYALVEVQNQIVNSSETKSVSSDALLWPQEYCGVESCAVYADCGTITNANAAWQNKWWPTNPWNSDTDGDGLSDSEEGSAFIYGSNTHTAENYEDCVAGGGLNPLSWDTDCDGLPDPWELEFTGTYNAGTSETSVSVTEEGVTNRTVTVNGAGWNEDGMDGTVDDYQKDYDHDGLANWQEYMVGAMRCWRYDDTVSPWTSHKTKEPDKGGDFDGYITGLTDTDLYNMLFNYSSSEYNPGLRSHHFDPGVYFSCALNDFEQGFKGEGKMVKQRCGSVWGHFYMFKDGINHDLSTVFDPMSGDNRYTMGVTAHLNQSFVTLSTSGTGIYPLKYITCDPRMQDTDCDSLDDYYELFHGLNPLLGKDRLRTIGSMIPPRDIIYEAYYDSLKQPSPWSAEANNWVDNNIIFELTRTDVPKSVKGKQNTVYDFFQFPWLAGLANADPDGDNIRNTYEGILANVQAAATYLHSDPSPLWMTDLSYVDSLTYRYYRINDPAWSRLSDDGRVLGFRWGESTIKVGSVEYSLTDLPWLEPVYEMGQIVAYNLKYNDQFNYWRIADYLFDFEENEGYDSDHDFLSDFEEGQGKTKTASDALYHDDPLRRQAMWFGGDEDKGFLQTPTPVDETVPTESSESEIRQNFLYFTVECWAKPDAATVGREELQTLIERPIWTGSANAADESYLRKNFLLGIKGGKWYAKFDTTGTDKNQAVEITEGPVASTNWTHLAATYDGHALRLYVNGVCRVTKETSLQPEHGISAMTVNEAGEMNLGTTWTSWKMSILVGASAISQEGIIFDYQWQTRAIKYYSETNPLGLNLDTTTGISSYDNFYRGYIDEVRVWDGARDAADILSDYNNRTRYTTALVQQNREAVFTQWAKGARRAPVNDLVLPPELMYHWSFDNIAGAVTTNDVITAPAGFSAPRNVTDVMAPWARPKGWTNCWRTAIVKSIKSRVYTDEAWVPWINDTVSHLPRYDKTTLDSVYWSADYAGITPAAASGQGYSSFTFPRTAELPSRRYQMRYSVGTGADDDPYTGDTRWQLAQKDATMEMTYRFARRNRELDGFDLLPFGGAYAKRISAAEGGMWDDGTAADAWAETGADSNNDGLPDWWTEYAKAHYSDDPTATITWDTIVNYHGVKMAAHQAYKRDLAKGMLSDCNFYDEYADTRDLDGDGMPDWWEDIYGIDTDSATDAAGDPDHDGLSNLQEYKVSEIGQHYLLNPTLASSVSDEVDYFLQITNETDKAYGQYLGEVYADHDFMEDDNEDAADLDRTLYDAYSDKDEDGWTAFSEMRYSTYKMGIAQRFLSHLVGDEEVKDSPVPVIHATLRYNGANVLAASNATVVVQAYTGNNLQKEANATYTVKPGETVSRKQILGAWSDRTIHGTLTPGHIITGEDKFTLEFLFVQSDDVFSWTINTNASYTGTYEEMYLAYQQNGDAFKLASDQLKWQELTANNTISYTSDAQSPLQVAIDTATGKGHFLLCGKRAGEIDCTTGDYTLNLESIGDIQLEGLGYTMKQCFFRLGYSAKIPTMQTKMLTVSLATPDSGALTEGTTAFTAYIDLDNDGYTVEKDPIGFVKGVEIGWDQVPEIVLEMTDDSQAAGKRFAFGDDVETLRIIRTTMNGAETLNGADVKRRIVYSRTAADVARKNVYEADLVSGSKFGLDWSNLRGDIDAMSGTSVKDITTVGYTIVSGAGSVLNIDPESVITNFTVSYAAEATAATCVAPAEKEDGVVKSARPTFRWTAPDGYTAFRLEIGDKSKTDWFWSSDLQVLPAKNTSGEYEWKAPVFIGTNVTGEACVLANGSNYTWRVALYNAKFSKTNDTESCWSEPASFSTLLATANDLTTAYGSATVTVKYFGPATNTLDTVIVQLFKTADFTGTPEAQTRLYATNGLAKGLATASQAVTLNGLSAGDHYAVAFIDRNGNGQRDRYETWGYAAQVGLSKQAIWTPTALAIDPACAKIPSATVYMEDTDVNQDGILDWDQDIATYFGVETSSGTGADTSDVDGDGLTADTETSDTYTDSQKWDTEGDLMPDGWEAKFADTDPLDADADTVVDGDVMAYAEVTRTLVTDAAGNRYLVNPTNETARVGDSLGYDQLMTTYDYAVIQGTGTNAVTKTLCGVGTNLAAVAGETFLVDKVEKVTAVLVHAQVYDAYGYNMNTCVAGQTSVNTKPFQALDKYMLVRYLTAIGISSTNAVPMTEAAMNKEGKWSDWTLKPGETDCDRDGMADGWELYMMFGTNTVAAASQYATPADTPINPWNYADARETSPGGEMTNVDEYHDGDMPTDPWNPNSLYESLKQKGILLDGTDVFPDNGARRFRLGLDEYDLDWDNDLIKNLNEYQAYLLDRTNLDDLNTENAWSNGSTPDYFRACRSTYLGALFNGAEFIEPWNREKLDISDLSMAGTRDDFQSGWDIWSIVRFNEEKNASTDSHTKKVNYLIKYLTIRYGEEFTGVTEEEAITFHNTKSKCECSTVEEAISHIGGLDYIKQLIAENGTSTLTASGYEIPDPTVYLTIKYAGNDSQEIVVESYQTSSTYPEAGEQMVARWSQNVLFDSGVAYAKLELPGKGSLKQGPARFIAYIDRDGDGQYSAADTYGTASADVGYRGASLSMRLADPNVAAYPILRTSVTNDQNVVALVRSQVNGQILYGGKNGSARVVYYTTLNNNENALAAYPSEWVGADWEDSAATYIGLDKYLSTASVAELGTNALEDVASVTYEVVYLRNPTELYGGNEGSRTINLTGDLLNHYVLISNGQVTLVNQSLNDEFTVYYSLKRDVASALAVATGTGDDYTFSFKVPNYGKANTKFWLMINGTQYPSGDLGYQLKADAEGLVVLDKAWFEEQGIDSAVQIGAENKFAVSLGNDKYPTAGGWSDDATFLVGNAASRAGQIVVQVKHPTEPADTFAGNVTVAVYETPDLVNPVKVEDSFGASSPITIDGLREGGSYYVAAWYVKNSADGRSAKTVRLPYDTWGYLCNLCVTNTSGIAVSNAFDAVTVKAAKTVSVTNTIWLQDTDYNDNGAIDRSEPFAASNGLVVTSLAGNYLNKPTKDPGDKKDDREEEEEEEEASTSVDVMAYAKVPYTCVAIQVPNAKNPSKLDTVWYAVTGEATGTNETTLGISIGTPITNFTSLATTYTYAGRLGLGTNCTFAADATNKVVDIQVKDLVLVHAQVHDYFGFNANTANGYLSSVERVNTKDVTSADKVAVTNYLAHVLGVTEPCSFKLPTGVADGDPVGGGVGDGILDGWELYTMFAHDGTNDGLLNAKDGQTLQIEAVSLTNDTTKTVLLSPWNYADRNQDADGDGLTNLLEYDGGYAPTDPSNKITAGDGITDYYAWLYHLKGDEAGQDWDGDGLSNYAEYLISEVFQYTKLDPDDPKTDGSCVDYFRKMGELYFGEIFTDHDQVDDLWEESFADAADDGASYANRYIYDPSRDADKDGWSNFAEAQAGTNPELKESIGVDGYTYAEHPVPVIEAHVTYNGRQNGIIAPLVFKAYNESFDADMVANADATWTVAAASDTTSESSTKDRAKYMGKNPCVVRTFTLGPGAVMPGTVRIYFRDQGWEYAAVKDSTELASYPGDSAQAKWYALVQDNDGILSTCVTNETKSIRVGTVDYTTGRVMIDFGDDALTRSVYARCVNATSDNSDSSTDKNYISKYWNCEKLNLAESYVKVEWTSRVVGSTLDGTYYLGDADEVTSSNPGLGYVREGLTKFVVFADQDSSGDYTAGEPFGFVHSVDIGWQGAKFSVELTDTHPVFARLNLKDCSNDRTYWSSMSDTITSNKYGVASAPSGNVRVRVVRTSVNGKLMTDMKNPLNTYEYAPQEVVMDKTFNTDIRAYLHEGDFLDASTPDIDWSTLASDAKKYGSTSLSWGWPDNVTCVTYRVVFGDGELTTMITNPPSLKSMVDRRFDTEKNTVEVKIKPYASVTTYNTRPTFRWAITDGEWNYNSYSAFRLQILEGSGTSVVYDSDILPMPGYETRDNIHYYVWTAPSVVDNLLQANGYIARNDTYKWRVTVYNSKFNGSNGEVLEKPALGSAIRSDDGTLTTEVNVTQDVNDHQYSSIPVCVKYTGPAAVLERVATFGDLKGKVRVQAFATADFSGAPISEALVTNDVADTAKTMANGKLYGLPHGSACYLRAYIDSNGNLKKDEWESWGAATSVVAAGETTPVGIYIEDADTDDDWLPDAYEFAMAGWKPSTGWLSKLGKDISGEFIVTEKLYTSVANTTLSAGVSTGMSGATLTVFTYDDVAALVCGSTEYGVASVDDIRKAVQKKVQAGTLKITSITLDPTGQKVVLGVEAETAQTIAGRMISKIYDFDTSTTVKVRIYKKDSLVTADWGEPLKHVDSDPSSPTYGTEIDYYPVKIDSNLSALVEVSVEGVDMAAGFYKVEVEQ